jgi:glycine/D-amino acid oxidase-like deaminating enzyme/nitrite reductase/ring-hydroxylating ferredoxin subunit
MISNHAKNCSVWLADAPQTDYPRLTRPYVADVAVVGGGITGLTTALLLQRAGMNVVLIEADRIGCGVTGSSTAKVTSLHAAIYRRIASNFGAEAAYTYGQANQEGLALVASFAREAETLGFDCRFERQPAFTYTCQADRVQDIQQEVEAASGAGLPARFTTEVQLPFAVQGAVCVQDQAQFDPYQYCVAVARALVQGGGTIFEMTRVQDVVHEAAAGLCRVQSGGTEVTARHVVVATLLPFLDRGGFFARAYPSRSYGISVTLDAPAPAGMYINIDSPTRSVRPLADGRGIIVVGEQHKVGQEPDTRRRYAALESWVREWFPVRSIDHRWSSQDYISADSLPYIGRVPLSAGEIWTATGFGKWGLTTGSAAAILLAELIQGREHPWASLFDPLRADVLPSAKKLIAENTNAAKRFVGDRLRSLTSSSLDQLPAGEGAIVKDHGKSLAAYRDPSGGVQACSPLCTHMGCYVQWNSAEQSWDCPCHGSRFGVDGQVLQGPAVRPLDKKDVSQP